MYLANWNLPEKLFLVHFLLQSNVHFWNQYEKADFLYPIQPIQKIIKIFIS